MRISNETGLLQGYVVTSREPPQAELSLVVRGTFPIGADGELVRLEGLEAIEQRGALDADAFFEGDDEREGALRRASDFAEFKPRAEVLVYGSCRLPGRVTSTELTLGVGNWSKTVIVTGDRRWRDGKPTPPELFDEMPLDFTRAFGGESSLTNPAGIGLDDGRLPNLELPEDRITSPEARPAPAALNGINPAWPTRRGKRGTAYGPGYARKRAPYHAEDFDWTYFMAAPADQWIPGGYLKGDERIVAHNLFVGHPKLETRLPGLRVRAFLRDDTEAVRELKLNLDTVVFDGDRDVIELSWRGLTPVRERDLDDVTHVIVAQEALDAPPEPVAVYEAKLAAFAADPTGYQSKLEEMRTVARIDEPDPLTTRLLDKGLPVPPEAQAQLKKTWEVMEGQGADTELMLQQIDEAHDNPPDDPPPAVPAFPEIPPRVFLRPQYEVMKAQADMVRAQLPPDAPTPDGLAALEKRLADPKLRDIDPTIVDIADGEPGPGADLTGQDLTDRDLSGADLRGATLDGCVCIRTNFTGANLVGAKMRGAMLFKARCDGAFMTGVDLSRCNAAYASFVGTQLDQAILDGGYFDHADLTRARLDAARGDVVNFTEASMMEIRAEGVRLHRCELMRARLGAADLRGADLEGCRFAGLQAEGARFDEAQLAGAVFSQGALSRASFFRSRLAESIWLETTLDDTDFAGADLADAHFTKSNLDGARLEGADLRRGRLYRCLLRRTDFSRANLHGADLSKTRLGHTKFVNANLYDAKFVEARGPRCDFKGANLERTRFDANEGPS